MLLSGSACFIGFGVFDFFLLKMGLLKGLDPILTADLLYVLRLAGHGDEIVLCDCNFPAFEVASKSTTGKLVILAGVDCPSAARAICSVFPMDCLGETFNMLTLSKLWF